MERPPTPVFLQIPLVFFFTIPPFLQPSKTQWGGGGGGGGGRKGKGKRGEGGNI